MKKIYLNTKEVEGRRFYYFDFGSETHGRTSFRLWVHYRLVGWEAEEDGSQRPVLEFPVRGATLAQGKKPSTVIMRPGTGVVYNVYVPCGYRGDGRVEKWNPEPTRVFGYSVYSSPRGSLGVSHGYLVELQDEVPLTYQWRRTGRLYGKPASGTVILYPDGREEDLEETELCEIEDLGEEV